MPKIIKKIAHPLLSLIESWHSIRGGVTCQCGGTVRTGHTPVKFVVVANGVWSSVVNANCDRCELGERFVLTSEKLAECDSHDLRTA